MFMNMKAFLLLLAYGSSVRAATAYTQQLCATKLGTASVQNVPLTTWTINIPVTVNRKTTSTPVTTVTPPPMTTTTSTTATFTNTVTAPPNTQVVTATSTGFTTLTSTATSTITDTIVTTTTVTSSSTSTVPTPAGFTPISKEAGYVAKVKPRNVHDLAARGAQKYVASCKKGVDRPVFSPDLYPVAVTCVKFVENVTTKTQTVTATAISTTTRAAATSTTTATASTMTTSIVVPPDVTSTVTVATTATVQTSSTTTVTTIATSTATETAIVPGPTVYAACAADNIATTANGGYAIQVISTSNGSFSRVTGVSTAVDCYVACQRSLTCRGTFLVDATCYNIVGGTCSAGTFQGESFQTLSTRNPGFTVSNGPCGLVANGGNQVQD